MSLGSLNFKSRRAGKQPRAHILIRMGRMLRRKRVSYARTGAAHALLVASRELETFRKLAAKYDVPIDEIAPLPRLPDMPGEDWVNCLRNMGELNPPVKAEPAPSQAVTV